MWNITETLRGETYLGKQLEELISTLQRLAFRARSEGDIREYFRLREELGLAEAELSLGSSLKPCAA